MVDVKDDEAGDDQHDEKCDNFEGNITLLLQREPHNFLFSCNFSSVFGQRFNDWGLSDNFTGSGTGAPITNVSDSDCGLVGSIIEVLI